MSIRWDTSGLNFDGIRDRIHERMAPALQQGAEVILTKSKELVPVADGNLQDSGAARVVGLTAEITYPGPYARYQEFGMYYRRAHVTRHGRHVPLRYGPPLKHTNGSSFFLTIPMVTEAEPALRAIKRVLFA
jgi:hypothetical protein